MCGIVGFLNGSISNQDYKQERSLFENLLYADAVRGWDSTGIMYVKGAQAEVYKKAMPASDFLDLKTTSKILTGIDGYSYIIGHNRWATAGAVTNANAHPFQVGPITLVHNGTLKGHRALPGCNGIDVDSLAITKCIADMGVEKAAPLFNGAFALVWHDSRNDTINLLRNEERPLYFGFVRPRETAPYDVVIASEYQMIYWIAERNGYKVKDVRLVSPGKLLVFNKKDLGKYEVKEQQPYVAPKSPEPQKWNSEVVNKFLKPGNLEVGQVLKLKFEDFITYQKDGNWGYFSEYYVYNGQPYEVKLSGLTVKEAGEIANKFISAEISGAWQGKDDEYPIISVTKWKILSEADIKLLPSANTKRDSKVIYRVFNGREVTKEEWSDRTKCGCAWCGDVPEDKDAPDLHWDDFNTFTCAECTAELLEDRKHDKVISH